MRMATLCRNRYFAVLMILSLVSTTLFHFQRRSDYSELGGTTIADHPNCYQYKKFLPIEPIKNRNEIGKLLEKEGF